MPKKIVVSGTPGTGKTTIAKKISEIFKIKRINVNRLINKHNLCEYYDKKRKCKVVDEKKLAKLLIDIEDDAVIDSHLAHYMSARKVKLCIITTTNLKSLKERLKKRRYNKAKIRENLEAEIFHNVLHEAEELGHNIIILDTTKEVSKKTIKELVGPWLK